MEEEKSDWSDKKYIYVDVNVFNVDILFFINHSQKEIHEKIKTVSKKKLHKSETEEWDDITTHGRLIPFYGGYIILLKFNTENFRKSIGIAVHEITHAVQYLLRDRRTPLNIDTEEVYAYLTEFITVEFLSKLY